MSTRPSTQLPQRSVFIRIRRPGNSQLGQLARLALATTLAGALVAPLSACNQAPRRMAHGTTGITAAYSAGTLSAVLPPEVAVPAAVAAMEQTFRSRGYSIAKSTATGEQGLILARPPRTTTFPEVEVIITSVIGGTRVAISNKPWGDEGLSRSLMDSMLQRLGL